jgi:hypothetical protein
VLARTRPFSSAAVAKPSRFCREGAICAFLPPGGVIGEIAEEAIADWRRRFEAERSGPATSLVAGAQAREGD